MRRFISKGVSALALTTGLMTGCATMGWTSDKGALVKTAAFDHNCPAEQVKILGEQEEGIGAASFRLDICGKTHVYKRAGTMFYDAEKGSPVPGGGR